MSRKYLIVCRWPNGHVEEFKIEYDFQIMPSLEELEWMVETRVLNRARHILRTKFFGEPVLTFVPESIMEGIRQ